MEKEFSVLTQSKSLFDLIKSVIVTFLIIPAVFTYFHRGPSQSVWVADCYFIVNVIDLPFASLMAIYR